MVEESSVSTTPALKPCPFCGPQEKPERKVGFIAKKIWCPICGTCLPIIGSRDDTIAAWNERPGETALLAACRDSAAFFDEIIKGFNITNDDAQSIRLRDQLRAVIASVEP